MNLRRRSRKKRGRPVVYTGRDARVPHRERRRFTRRSVVGITLRLIDGLPRLRGKRFIPELREAFQRGCAKAGFAICQFSIQGNHLHLVVEADNHVALAKGMQAFAVRIARAVNRIAGRKGRVFNDRYPTFATSRRPLSCATCSPTCCSTTGDTTRANKVPTRFRQLATSTAGVATQSSHRPTPQSCPSHRQRRTCSRRDGNTAAAA